MHASAPHPYSPPPQRTGDLETDAAAAIDWLYSHPERWLEDNEEPLAPSDAWTAA